MDVLDIKNTSATSIGYNLPPAIYENTDLNLMLKTSLPIELKVNITIDGIRQRSMLTTKNTIRFTKKFL